MKMEMFHRMTVFIVFTLLTCMPKISESQVRTPPMPARPLCLSQFALANHACSFLPYNPNPFDPLPPSEDPDEPDELLHANSGHHGSENGRRDRDRHEDGRGSGNGHGGVHRHHAHRHRLNHRQRRHHETPVEEECCRWVKAVDDQCVCDVLVRLPVFLARPWHRFQIVVDESCNVTYSCSGRVI